MMAVREGLIHCVHPAGAVAALWRRNRFCGLSNPARALTHLTTRHKKPDAWSGILFNGGERGIRTLEQFNPLHTFQACSFSHSDTSPKLIYTILSKILASLRSRSYRLSGDFSAKASELVTWATRQTQLKTTTKTVF
jgi:hypothetical protein